MLFHLNMVVNKIYNLTFYTTTQTSIWKMKCLVCYQKIKQKVLILEKTVFQ